MNATGLLRTSQHVAVALLAATLAAGSHAAASTDAPNIDFRRGFSEVAERATPAVVFIQVEKVIEARGGGLFFNDPFGGFDDEFMQRFFGGRPRRPPEQQFRQRGQGSGFIVSEDGYILTNHHVVGGADSIRVTLKDGRVLDATVIGSDERSEVAVIKVDADDLPVLPLGDAEDLRVGEWVIAIGNPFGLSETLTVGVVSAKGRSGMRIADYEDFIQTDAAINPGNSGGPLLNVEGKVVGINTAIYSRSGGHMGIGFAVPVNMAIAIKEQLVAGGRVDRGYLGVLLNQSDLDEELAREFGLPRAGGSLIAEVQPDTPAAKAGLKAGDVIMELNGRAVANNAALRNQVAMLRPGSKATLGVFRDGETLDITVTIGSLDEGIASAEAERAKGAEGFNDTLLERWGFRLEPLDDEQARRLGVDADLGLRVSEVRPGSPAARRGIVPDSVVVEVNRTRVRTLDAVRELIGDAETDGILLRVRHPRGMMSFVVLRAER